MIMPQMTRRQLLRSAGVGAAALALAPLVGRAADEEKKTAYELPKLPYALDALEPYIDAETMEIHHDRHHRAYVDNLNKALQGHPDLFKPHVSALLVDITSVPADIRQAVINNGGGHANHTMFWRIMGPKAGGQPKGELAKAIDEAFGSFDQFQAKLTDAAIKRFGSGWAWLVLGKEKLEVLSTANQDSPYLKHEKPIMGIDVWEHAYYLKYKNKRPDYVKAWWNVVNWDGVGKRYEDARKQS
jgi:Fe-Mn family superoxide dismutase